MNVRRLTITGIGALAVLATGLALQPGTAGAATPTSATPAAAHATAAPATAAACDAAPWAARIQGRPAGYQPGARGGDYLWHDRTGFHLRVTHRSDDRAVFTGRIAAPTALRIEPVKLEKGDVLTLSADHRSFTFAFVNHGYTDGVDFHTYCAPSLTVSNLNVGNAALPTSRVYLGATRAHPSAIPFTVHRTATPAA